MNEIRLLSNLIDIDTSRNLVSNLILDVLVVSCVVLDIKQDVFVSKAKLTTLFTKTWLHNSYDLIHKSINCNKNYKIWLKLCQKWVCQSVCLENCSFLFLRYLKSLSLFERYLSVNISAVKLNSLFSSVCTVISSLILKDLHEVYCSKKLWKILKGELPLALINTSKKTITVQSYQFPKSGYTIVLGFRKPSSMGKHLLFSSFSRNNSGVEISLERRKIYDRMKLASYRDKNNLKEDTLIDSYDSCILFITTMDSKRGISSLEVDLSFFVDGKEDIHLVLTHAKQNLNFMTYLKKIGTGIDTTGNLNSSSVSVYSSGTIVTNSIEYSPGRYRTIDKYKLHYPTIENLATTNTFGSIDLISFFMYEKVLSPLEVNVLFSTFGFRSKLEYFPNIAVVNSKADLEGSIPSSSSSSSGNMDISSLSKEMSRVYPSKVLRWVGQVSKHILKDEWKPFFSFYFNLMRQAERHHFVNLDPDYYLPVDQIDAFCSLEKGITTLSACNNLILYFDASINGVVAPHKDRIDFASTLSNAVDDNAPVRNYGVYSSRVIHIFKPLGTYKDFNTIRDSTVVEEKHFKLDLLSVGNDTWLYVALLQFVAEDVISKLLIQPNIPSFLSVLTSKTADEFYVDSCFSKTLQPSLTKTSQLRELLTFFSFEYFYFHSDKIVSFVFIFENISRRFKSSTVAQTLLNAVRSFNDKDIFSLPRRVFSIVLFLRNFVFNYKIWKDFDSPVIVSWLNKLLKFTENAPFLVLSAIGLRRLLGFYKFFPKQSSIITHLIAVTLVFSERSSIFCESSSNIPIFCKSDVLFLLSYISVHPGSPEATPLLKLLRFLLLPKVLGYDIEYFKSSSCKIKKVDRDLVCWRNSDCDIVNGLRISKALSCAFHRILMSIGGVNFLLGLSSRRRELFNRKNKQSRQYSSYYFGLLTPDHNVVKFSTRVSFFSLIVLFLSRYSNFFSSLHAEFEVDVLSFKSRISKSGNSNVKSKVILPSNGVEHQLGIILRSMFPFDIDRFLKIQRNNILVQLGSSKVNKKLEVVGRKAKDNVYVSGLVILNIFAAFLGLPVEIFPSLDEVKIADIEGIVQKFLKLYADLDFFHGIGSGNYLHLLFRAIFFSYFELLKLWDNYLFKIVVFVLKVLISYLRNNVIFPQLFIDKSEWEYEVYWLIISIDQLGFQTASASAKQKDSLVEVSIDLLCILLNQVKELSLSAALDTLWQLVSSHLEDNERIIFKKNHVDENCQLTQQQQLDIIKNNVLEKQQLIFQRFIGSLLSDLYGFSKARLCVIFSFILKYIFPNTYCSKMKHDVTTVDSASLVLNKDKSFYDFGFTFSSETFIPKAYEIRFEGQFQPDGVGSTTLFGISANGEAVELNNMVNKSFRRWIKEDTKRYEKYILRFQKDASKSKLMFRPDMVRISFFGYNSSRKGELCSSMPKTLILLLRKVLHIIETNFGLFFSDSCSPDEVPYCLVCFELLLSVIASDWIPKEVSLLFSATFILFSKTIFMRWSHMTGVVLTDIEYMSLLRIIYEHAINELVQNKHSEVYGILNELYMSLCENTGKTNYSIFDIFFMFTNDIIMSPICLPEFPLEISNTILVTAYGNSLKKASSLPRQIKASVNDILEKELEKLFQEKLIEQIFSIRAEEVVKMLFFRYESNLYTFMFGKNNQRLRYQARLESFPNYDFARLLLYEVHYSHSSSVLSRNTHLNPYYGVSMGQPEEVEVESTNNQLSLNRIDEYLIQKSLLGDAKVSEYRTIDIDQDLASPDDSSMDSDDNYSSDVDSQEVSDIEEETAETEVPYYFRRKRMNIQNWVNRTPTQSKGEAYGPWPLTQPISLVLNDRENGINLVTESWSVVNEQVKYSARCYKKLRGSKVFGRLVVTNIAMYFDPDPDVEVLKHYLQYFSEMKLIPSLGSAQDHSIKDTDYNSCMKQYSEIIAKHEGKHLSHKRKCLTLSTVVKVLNRRLNLIDAGLEFFFKCHDSTNGLGFESWVFDFSQDFNDSASINMVKGMDRRQSVIKSVWNNLTESCKLSSQGAISTQPGARRVELLNLVEPVYQAWQAGALSNFEYLIELNSLAGRSFNLLAQYPVFPWVLTNYVTPTIDLTEPENYRDLSKPVGALNPDRLQMFQDKFDSLEDEIVPKYFYGSHYSTTAGVVLYFLVRNEPFTSLHIKLQAGNFDYPDRLFNSVASSFEMCMTSQSEVKEVIPEFYFSPHFLKNVNNHNFGMQQSGIWCDDVELPPYASSPNTFIEIMREALESDIVSQNLHHWVDLIFGYKQTGVGAMQAKNIFYHLTYPSSIDISKIDDPTILEATLTQTENFGLCPNQLFAVPSPRRGRIAVESYIRPGYSSILLGSVTETSGFSDFGYSISRVDKCIKMKTAWGELLLSVGYSNIECFTHNSDFIVVATSSSIYVFKVYDFGVAVHPCLILHDQTSTVKTLAITSDGEFLISVSPEFTMVHCLSTGDLYECFDKPLGQIYFHSFFSHFAEHDPRA